MLLFVVTIGYSQTKETTKIDSTQLNAMQVYSDIKAGLTGLAAGLKTTTEHVYPIIVKQQRINAIGYCFFPILLIIALVSIFLVIKNRDELFDYDDTYSYVIIILSGIGVLLLIFCMCVFNSIFTGFFNPEYGAIQDIVNLVK